MKKTIENGINKERVISYIPLRYILNLVLIFLEIVAVIAILSVITIYVPYFYLVIISFILCFILENLIENNKKMLN